jgi:hypothetical protein
MDEDFEKKFEKIEDYSEKTIEDFIGSTKSSEEQILEEIKSFVNTLNKKNGVLSPTVSNLKAIDKYSFTFSKWLNEKSSYSKSVNSFVDSLSGSSGLIYEYFNSPDINTEGGIYSAILVDSEKEALNSLLGSGINANFTSGITKALKDSVKSGSDTKEVYAFLKTYIQGNKETLGTLERYTRQVASDTISQFNSTYLETFSRDLGLHHFYYKGTKARDTREFCNHLAGKFYTEEELEEYVTRRAVNGWQGMIKGTNWSNFKIYRGGYNCRHYLLPVSESVYKARLAR